VLLYAHYSLQGRSLPGADLVFPLYIVDELPTGLSGLLVAGVLAAAMSTQRNAQLAGASL
jgi:Na+/proline symporter